MYCKKCGAYNSNNSLRCENCGDYFVIQLKDSYDLDKEKDEESLSNNDNEYNNNQKSNKKKRDKVKYKKVRKKKKKSTLFSHDRKEKKEKKNANKNYSDDNYKEKEVIVKTSLSSKLAILFLTFLVILLFSISSVLGLYILKDKVIKMPDVVGLDVNEATNILNSSNIIYEIEEQNTSSDNMDKVLDQNPSAGTYFLKNRTIRITVGVNKKNTKDTINNKDDDNIVLDNYIGMSIEDVKKNLDKLGIGYEVKEVDSSEDANTIIKQYPSEGTKIDKNTIITLYVVVKEDDNVVIDGEDDTTDLNNKYS